LTEKILEYKMYQLQSKGAFGIFPEGAFFHEMERRTAYKLFLKGRTIL